MKNSMKVCLCIVIGLGAFGILGSATLFFLSIPDSTVGVISAWVGIVGTAASVVLSVAAMVYSNKSSKDAENSLKEVNNHYKALCEKLTREEVKGPLGRKGIQAIVEENERDKEDPNSQDGLYYIRT